jgi:hypothetical protein
MAARTSSWARAWSPVSPGACDLDIATDAAAIETHYDTLSDHCPLIVDLMPP